MFTLRNHAGRVLTMLHVAHLQVHLVGHKAAIASGRCEPGEWFGPQPPPLPLTLAALLGISGASGNGQVCPMSGRAAGLPADGIAQADDRSGGLTSTSLPELERFSPADGAELYGPFVVLAQLSPHVRRRDARGPHLDGRDRPSGLLRTQREHHYRRRGGGSAGWRVPSQLGGARRQWRHAYAAHQGDRGGITTDQCRAVYCSPARERPDKVLACNGGRKRA